MEIHFWIFIHYNAKINLKIIRFVIKNSKILKYKKTKIIIKRRFYLNYSKKFKFNKCLIKLKYEAQQIEISL